MSDGVRAAFLVQRLGPYHHARMSAWEILRGGAVNVIEFRPADSVYAWAAVETGGSYRRVPTQSRPELRAALEKIEPQVVVCVGYADPEIHQAMTWALARRIPLVTCSDSTFEDERRSWLKEEFKRGIVGAFDAALVAGERARGYLEHLRFDPRHCFQPWDVVDNAYFARGAQHARDHAAATRARLKLPTRYFLCVARFVPKKNLERLISAYAGYVAKAGENSCALVLSGTGPLEARLRAQVAAAGLDASVHFAGFLQYPDLPACYGLADALVLPSVSDQWGLVVNEAMASGLPVLVSNRCGCVPDLVRNEENGFSFDPENMAELTACLAKIAGLDGDVRAAMGRRSRQRIESFSCVAFAGGLEAAIACALDRPRGRASPLTRGLVGWLAMRRVSNS